MLILRSFSKTRILTILATALTLIVAACTIPAVQAAPDTKPVESLQVEIAQDMLTFVADEGPVHEDGMPSYGNPFVIQGYIYPEGTLDSTNGIVVTQNDDGTFESQPEFPDKVIGTWTCRGWFIGNGLHTTDEPWASTTQVFSFGEGYGDQTIVSDGYEIPFGIDEPVHRAVTGGTGDYLGARGEQIQGLIGTNATEAANFAVELLLSKK